MGVALRVVSYNVHSLTDDLAALQAVVRGLEPDVLVVQEAPRRWRWRARCARLADRFGMFVAVGGLPSLGNLVLTNMRVKVLDTWCLRYLLTPGRHMRGAAFARCAVPGADPFVIAGSHLSTDQAERPAQAAELASALAAVTEPVVLGADLNETPGGAVWRRLTGPLRDAATLAGEGGVGTFPTSGPDRRIDAILIDPRFDLRGYRVIDDPVAVRASDHFPLVVDLTR